MTSVIKKIHFGINKGSIQFEFLFYFPSSPPGLFFSSPFTLFFTNAIIIHFSASSDDGKNPAVSVESQTTNKQVCGFVFLVCRVSLMDCTFGKENKG